MSGADGPSPAEQALRTAVETLLSRKAENVMVLDLEPIASFTGAFVLCHGSSERQVRSLVDEVVEKVREASRITPRVEGREAAEWILLDYGDFVVHVFSEEARKFYRLDALWQDARGVSPAEAAAGALG